MRAIIIPTSSPISSEQQQIKTGAVASIRIIGSWQDGEYANIQYYPLPTAPEDYYYEDVQKRLHTKNPHVLVYGPFEFRVTKEATAGAGGVELVWI